MADLWKTGRGPGAPKKLVPRLCIAVSCKSNELRRRSRAKPKDFVGSLTCRICSYVICDTYKVCVYISIHLHVYMYTYITLHYIVLHCIALLFFALHCIALHAHTHIYIFMPSHELYSPYFSTRETAETARISGDPQKTGTPCITTTNSEKRLLANMW